MLLGLWHPALVGGYHEQGDVDCLDPGEHVLDEPLVAGHVDERHLRPTGERRPGKAEIDGEPSSLLLGPAVGITPGQSVDQRRLAMVDMTGGPDHRHRLPGAGCGEGLGDDRVVCGLDGAKVDNGRPGLTPRHHRYRPGSQQPRPYQVGSGPIHHHQRGWDATARRLSRPRQRTRPVPSDHRHRPTPGDPRHAARSDRWGRLPSSTGGCWRRHHHWRRARGWRPTHASTGPPHRSALAAG